MNRLFVITVLFSALIACSEANNNFQEHYLPPFMQGDKVALVYDTNFTRSWTQKEPKTWHPDSIEWEQIHTTYQKAISEGAFKILKEPVQENLEQLYYRQYAFYYDKKGRKTLLINAFKYHLPKLGSEELDTLRWKKELLLINDDQLSNWRLIIHPSDTSYIGGI